MADLSEILGQNTIIDSILKIFEKNSNSIDIVLLEGDSGTGKSHIAEDIVQRWVNEEERKEALLLQGDLLQVERPLYPFNAGLIKQVASFEKRKSVKKGASEMLKGIPFAGDFASFLLDRITDSKINVNQSKLGFLQKEEFELVLALNSFYRNSQLLLVADNLHWWDESSISLLNALLSKELIDSFPFLKSIKVLGLLTTDQAYLAKNEIDELKVKSNPIIFNIPKTTKDEFKAVLNYFGIRGLGKKNEDLIFNLSGGHLEILKTLFQYTSPQDLKFLNESLANEIPQGEQAFLEKIFSLRLKHLGAESEQIINLLEYASVIGLNFNFEEILCLTREKEETLSDIIARAREAHFIDGNDIKNSFSHEVIREFFWCRIQSKKSEYFKKFAGCLAQLRPGSYFQRASLLMDAGLIKDSLITYMLGYFKNIHDGIPVPALARTRIEQLCKLQGFEEYYDLMKDAYTSFIQGSYEKSKNYIRQIEDIYPEPLLAEKYYLLSLCLAKTLDRNDLIESKNCLLSWDSLKNKESELWIRIMLTLMSRYAHLNEYHEASAIERKIMMLLAERISFDPFAEYGLNILRRKASILHVGEIACKRTALCLSYFGETDGWFNSRFPIQYYMALANHSGNLIVAGEFESAYHYAQQSILFKENYPEIAFPRLEIPINNLIVSGFLSNHLTSEKVLEIYDALFEQIENVEYRVLLQNNYFVFKALNNNLRESLKLCENLNNHLASTTRNDSYYRYFVGMNQAILYFLNGERLVANKIINELKLAIPQIPDKHYLLRRHEVIQILVQNDDIEDAVLWNSYVLDKFPNEIGPGWKFFGKGFLLSDMQFWSDS